MRMRYALILSLFVFTATTAHAQVGTHTLALPVAATHARTRTTIPLERFVQRYRLRVTSAPGAGRLTLQGNGLRLQIAPGLPLALINGNIQPLATAPEIVNGSLHIPRDIERGFPASLRQRASRVEGTVFLDPGHGGHDSGASLYGQNEKDLVLDIARRTGAYLQQYGVRVLYTRTNDRFIQLVDRAKMANAVPGSVFVSLHLNATRGRSAKDKKVTGIETFVLSGKISDSTRARKADTAYDLKAETRMSRKAERERIRQITTLARDEGKRLAQFVQSSLVQQLGETDRGVKQKNLAVLRENYFGPAILTELGFMTNPHTATQLKTAAYRDKAARALARGILAYLQSEE